MLTLAQNSTNYIELQPNTAWNFNCNDEICLEQGIKIANAFTIKVKTVDDAAYVYIRQAATSYPSGWNPAPVGGGSIAIDLISTTSTNATSVQQNQMTVTGTNALIFVQPKMSSNTSARNFNYDLILRPTGYEYFVPGYYTFTVTVSMTQP